ncbi:uncharacterized protein LTR77_003764 [Saxophila tyrrhenica]|uniref:Nineteen complex-related protein 2-domain-containing protein n=1 Tax=Saxophila tyrrhenica TaxID=1690608 RepID=A0AAV9PHY8_9PEZI|nr:hypothetical protein LTR77_003764 [Saxophila tyrrhenica]
MKKAFSSRRVPRKIGEDDDASAPGSAGAGNSDATTEPILKRPNAKPRKGSSLRTRLGPTAVEDEEPESGGVVAPRRSNLSRIAVQRNASKRSAFPASTLRDIEADEDDDRPSYSAESLQALKNSTPTTPHDIPTGASNTDIEDVSSETQDLDLSSKFGSSLARYQQGQRSGVIPSAGEIAEKKARRARMAKEQAAEEYISLNPSDPELDEDEDENVMRDETGRLVLKPKDKYQQGESRLVRDDEDIMENFDEFTEADGKIMLGRKAEAEAARKRKQDMAAQIAAAEGDSGSESDASEKERNEAFEAAQTRHGTYGAHDTADNEADTRPRTPPIITPLPTLDGVIEQLRKQVVDMQTSRMQKMQEMDALQREKVRLGEEEVRIQKALRETAEKFAALRAEKGIAAASETEPMPALLGMPPAAGLADLGSGEGESGATTDNEQQPAGRQGLGFGVASHGLDGLGSSVVSTPMQQDGVGDGGEDLDEMNTT